MFAPSANQTVRKIIAWHGPLWHRAKQLAVGVSCVCLLECTLLYHYWPGRFDRAEPDFFRQYPPKEWLDFDPYSLSQAHTSSDQLPLEVKELVFDILTIYRRGRPTGMYRWHFAQDCIAEDPWFRWQSRKELCFLQRRVKASLPSPVLSPPLIERCRVLYVSEVPLSESQSGRVARKVVIDFENRMETQSDSGRESIRHVLALDLNPDGLISYQRDCLEALSLISPRKDPAWLAYFCRKMRRCNAFWYRVCKSPAMPSQLLCL